MSDLLITDEPEVPFVARNVVNQLGDLWEVPVDKRQATNDVADQFVTRLFAEHVKALAETATRLGYGLGRRDAAEQIAQAITAHRDADDSTREFRLGLGVGARIAREFATRPSEPPEPLTHPEVPLASESALTGHPEASKAVSRPWPENGKPHPHGRCGDPNCGGDW